MAAKRSSYWASVDDESSARDAVRMAGLPVLIMAATEGLRALTQVIDGDQGAMWVSAGFAALLTVVAFRLRSGHAAWVPLVFLLFAVMTGFRLMQLVEGWNAAVIVIQLLTGWIIPLLCALLMIGGLRGWLWMRAHGIRRSF